MARYETAATIIDRAGRELGLWSSAVSDPFASSNPIAMQLCALLASAGQRLAREYEWAQLVREHTIIADGSKRYSLPADFLSLITESGYDRSSGLPLAAPRTPREWQALKASSVTGSIAPLVRVRGEVLEFYEAPATNSRIAFEYRSACWARMRSLGTIADPPLPEGSLEVLVSGAAPSSTTAAELAGVVTSVTPSVQVALTLDGAPLEVVTLTQYQAAALTAPAGLGLSLTWLSGTPAVSGTLSWPLVAAFGDAPSATADVVLLDPALMVDALKLAFKREKGMDTAAALADFERSLANAESAATPGRVLNLVGCGDGVHLIDGNNLPDTGYGQ